MRRHLISLGITSLIFSFGLLLGYYITELKIESIEFDIEKLKEEISTTELQFFLSRINSKISCELLLTQVKQMTRRADRLAESIEIYERSKSLESSRFQRMKENHLITLLKNWLLLEGIKRNCDTNYTTILYFYSKRCDNCPLQGFYLSYYKKLDLENLIVFPIEFDLEAKIVKILEISYNITKLPTLIIDGEKHEGFLEREELREIFCKKKFAFC